MNVPSFKKYYPSIDAMDNQQKEFFNFWRNQFEKGVIIDVDGQVSYLYCYAYYLLGLDPAITVSKLKNLAIAFGDEDTFLCQKWISDCYVILKDYKSAIKHFPEIPVTSKSTWATNDLLSLKLLVGERVTGRDVLTLNGPNVTKWGRTYINEIAELP